MSNPTMIQNYETTASQYGAIGIRVVVLPRPEKDRSEGSDDEPIFDPEDIYEDGKTAVSSYLEKPKGGRLCCVFLVNGQRQDALDNSFIVQQLEFKYLRSRMMIIVDVDGLHQEALGELMQGSRQSFYKGKVWEAVFSRLVATLKNDPDLKQFEREAEAEVASLETSDEKVREALDALIDAHHAHADHVATGVGPEAGLIPGGGLVGTGSLVPDKVVELLYGNEGVPGDFPVLVSAPPLTSIRLHPEDVYKLKITSEPSAKWSALTALTYTLDCTDGHLTVEENRGADRAEFTLRAAPEGDPDEYPVNCTFRAFARFAGHAQTRQLSIAVAIKPKPKPREIDLKQDPTYLRVLSRQPVRLSKTGDTHVRLEWDGKDELAVGAEPAWRFVIEATSPVGVVVHTGFSQPSDGRFSAIVGVPATSEVGDRYEFTVVGVGPAGKTLSTTFVGIVAEKTTTRKKKDEKDDNKNDDKDEKDEQRPRVIDAHTPTGGARRPPYEPKVIKEKDWDSGTCWDGATWTAIDAGAYQEPTDGSPLTLILNDDFAPLAEYRKYLVSTKKYVETEVENRLRKYKTHMYYHLYQMYRAEKAKLEQNASGVDVESEVKSATATDKRAEIHRVAMTLIKIMEVAR